MNPVLATPLNVSTSTGSQSFTWLDRLLYLAIPTVALLLLLIASRLHPSPLGYGTHEQLGLPPCTFFTITGVPCPSCGLTTSFVYAFRMQFHQALVTQPFGLLVFFLTLLSFPASAVLLALRVPRWTLMRNRVFVSSLYVLGALYGACWIYKIEIVKHFF